MKRIEFKLSMPGNPSWNGKWSGDEKRYALVRLVPDGKAAELLEASSWGYVWSDGWSARVEAREVPKGERAKKSAGFCGYDWMVSSILAVGRIELEGGGR